MARLFFACVLVALLAACNSGGEETGTQRASDTHPPPESQPAAALTWSAPEGWVAEEPKSEMRKGQYRLPSPFNDGADATATIFHFEGTGGDVASNLKRWYGQFEQPDGRSSADAARTIWTTYNGLQHTLVDLKGIYLHRDNMMGPVTEKRPDYRMLASVVGTPTGPYFVKVLGPEATMDYWETSFYEFLSSFQHGE